MKCVHSIARNGLLLLGFALGNCAYTSAQSGTSSALAGTVSDSRGAVVLDADVSAVNVDTKAVRNGQSDNTGRFLFSQIDPGNYQVTVKASGFAVQTSPATPVALGRTVTLNFTLHISASQNVEVSAEEGLLSLDNPNTTTTLEEKTIKSLPNP